MIPLILQIALSALNIVAARTSNPTANVAGDLLSIAAKVFEAYQKETGKPLDVSLIQPYEPIP